MFCVKCGAQVADGADFCSKCGAKTVVEADNSARNVQSAADTPNTMPENVTVSVAAPCPAAPVASAIPESFQGPYSKLKSLNCPQIKSVTYQSGKKLLPIPHIEILGTFNKYLYLPEENNMTFAPRTRTTVISYIIMGIGLILGNIGVFGELVGLAVVGIGIIFLSGLIPFILCTKEKSNISAQVHSAFDGITMKGNLIAGLLVDIGLLVYNISVLVSNL